MTIARKVGAWLAVLVVLALLVAAGYFALRLSRWTAGLVETSNLVLLLIGIAGLFAAAQIASRGGRALAAEQARKRQADVYQQLLQALRESGQLAGASEPAQNPSDGEHLAGCELRFTLYAAPEVARRYGLLRRATPSERAAELVQLLTQMRKDLGQPPLAPDDLQELALSLAGPVPLYPLRVRPPIDRSQASHSS
jgi:hypothetical protein